MCRIRLLSGTAEEEGYVPDILPWVKAAGDPYYDWFFPDHQSCTKFLRLALGNPHSEIFLGRIQALFAGAQLAGGFIALDGKDLHECRKADTRCLIAESSHAQRNAMAARLALSAGLFPPVSGDEYYLSKIGVNHDFRGRGCGSLLMEAYLDRGVKSGFRRYRLDVSVTNEVAIRCYEKFGFRTVNESTTKNRELTYFSMTYEH